MVWLLRPYRFTVPVDPVTEGGVVHGGNAVTTLVSTVDGATAADSSDSTIDGGDAT